MSNKTETKPISYFSLAPLSKIKAPVYFNALEEKLNDPSVQNIAVTGTYGSGKSSILESYIYYNDSKDNCLKISLANFCEKNGDLGNIDEKKIEEHILQQLFYQLPNDKIPFSGFKKINHLKINLQQWLIIKIIIWLFSLALMPKVIKLLGSNLQTITTIGFEEFCHQTYGIGTIINIGVLVLFCVGLFSLIKELISIKKKGQIKKLAMKPASIELSGDSILNKHIDELIYFFEATDKKIVIIEDLDRFNSIALFAKLREVNFIINNSPKVNQIIKFIYAIRDDIFSDNLIRMKFFDFILPIVPVINTTNSGDKMREYLNNSSEIPNAFINDVSLYIHDLRLIKNIVNEYNIYNGIINEQKRKRNIFLFSIILYKNLFPKEFGLEHSGNGVLHKIFNEKRNEILEHVLTEFKRQLNELIPKRNEISTETVNSEIKLREEYIWEILKTHANVASICNNKVAQISSDNNLFEELLTTPTIQVFKGSRIPNSQSLNFDDIQNKINPDKTYAERLIIFNQKENGKLEEINSEIAILKKKISELERKKLSSLIKMHKDNSWRTKLIIKDGEFSAEEELLLLLIRKGYIDENYELYLSHFYEGALSKGDFEFLLNIKNNKGDNFTTKLFNTSELVSRISVDEYEYKATLNIELIEYLLKRTNYKEDKRLSLLLEQFQNIDDAFENYILPLISHLRTTKKLINHFIELIVEEHYSNLWEEFEKLQNTEEFTRDEFLKLFLFLSEEHLIKLNNESGEKSLKKYLSEKDDFIEVFNIPTEIGNITRLISSLDLKFCNLIFKRYENNQVFNHIYQNCHYELNHEMLYLMLFYKYTLNVEEFEKLFSSQNYTCIFDSTPDVLNEYIIENFSSYVEKIYIPLESTQNESESAIASLIENLESVDDSEKLFSVLNKINTRIANIKEFKNEEKWSVLFKCDCVLPNWDNLISYYIVKENVLNKTITKWLNRKEVLEYLRSKTLFKHNYEKDIRPVISPLMNDIIENDDLSNDSYYKLLKSLYYTFPKIELGVLSSDKIEMLVTLKKIIFNYHHYNQLVEYELNAELITFTENNIYNFIQNYHDYKFYLELHLGLLDSNKVSFANKKSLIELVSLDNIDNSKIALSIGVNLLKARKNFIENEKIINVISFCSGSDLQLKLFDKYFVEFGFSEIDEILQGIGGEYKKASELRKRPVWEKHRLNLSIASKLLEIGYFHSIHAEDSDEIKIVVRYN